MPSFWSPTHEPSLTDAFAAGSQAFVFRQHDSSMSAPTMDEPTLDGSERGLPERAAGGGGAASAVRRTPPPASVKVPAGGSGGRGSSLLATVLNGSKKFGRATKSS